MKKDHKYMDELNKVLPTFIELFPSETCIAPSETQLYSSATKIHSSTIDVNNEQDFKRRETNDLSYILRKVSGVPLAILYGLFFYLIMNYVILPDPCDYLPLNATNINKICPSLESDMNDTNRDILNKTQDKNTSSLFLSHEYHPKLAYVSLSLSTSLAFASVFSRGTRCTMLLILPSLITRRSQTFLYTFIAGFLAQGPLTNLGINFNELLQTSICLYDTLMKNVHNWMDMIQRRVDHVSDGILSVRIEITSTLTWKMLREIIKAPRLSEIKNQVSKISDNLSVFGYYATIARRVLTVISIVMILIDAIRYLRSYYSDTSFDNKYISDNVRHIWKENDYEQLTPLRRWEMKNDFTTATSPKFTKDELMKSFKRSLPTLLFSLFVGLIMTCDYLLARLLQHVRDNENFTVSFDGVDQNFVNKMKRLNVSTVSCLPQPTYTPSQTYTVISILILISLISTIVEIYMSRIRARMCDLFYKETEYERAKYLHYRLKTDRVERKGLIRLIIQRKYERRQKLKVFYPWSDLPKPNCRLEKKTFRCSGCDCKETVLNSKWISFSLGTCTINDRICKSCFQDF